MHDTSPEAARIQAEIHRRMTGEQKLRIALEMSDAVRSIACARIRAADPHFDESAVLERLMWELYGFRRQR